MPPLTCWTVLRLDSTPITPGASAALASGAVAAQAVKPPMPSAMVSRPAAIVLAVRGWAVRSGPRSAATDTPGTVIAWVVIDTGSLLRKRLSDLLTGGSSRWPQAGRARGPLIEMVQDLAARADPLDDALAQHEDGIDLIEDAGPMADDDDHRPILLHRGDCLVERRLALGVKIGVRLVEHDQPGAAQQRTRQADPLALAARQQSALLADAGLVALGQAQDQLVGAGDLGRVDDLLGRGRSQPGDVLGHRAVEQRDLLGQVADMLAEIAAVPGRDVGTA